MADEKYLIVKASGGGGLGDCIKSLLVGILYAKHSERILLVDWSGGVYADAGSDPYPMFFSVEGVPEVRSFPDTDDVYPSRWRGRLGQSLHQVYTDDGWPSWDRATTIKEYSADLSKLDYSEQALVIWDFDQLNKLALTLNIAKQPMLTLYTQIAQQHLRLTADLQLALTKAYASFNNPELGIHIRATNEFRENKGAVVLDDFVATIENSGFSSGSLFLATDNAAVEEKLKARFPATQTLTKWFSQPGDSLHLNKNCPDKTDGLRAAILDIMMLSRCPNLLITPHSSFSELAQIMSPKVQNILSPKRRSKWQRLKQRLQQ